MSAPGFDTRRQLAEAARRGRRVTVLALVTSVVLAFVKIAAGIVGNSYALVADGIESVFDIFSSVIVLSGLRLSVIAPSDQFPYGVGKGEPLGALMVATMLVLAGIGIAVQAVREILTPHSVPAPFTLVVLVAVIITKEVLFRTLFARGESIGSRAVQTDAWHHRSDALTSAAAFIGISIALIMGEGFESADDWAALAACGLIVTNGVRLFRGALREILDAAAPTDVQAKIRDVAGAVRQVAGIDVCRVRRSGLAYLVDIHIEVDGALSVHQGHAIAHRVKDALLRSEVPVLDALVHVEPDRPHE
jgi:cation diffusion facilitator family transporter